MIRKYAVEQNTFTIFSLSLHSIVMRASADPEHCAHHPRHHRSRNVSSERRDCHHHVSDLVHRTGVHRKLWPRAGCLQYQAAPYVRDSVQRRMRL